MKKVNKCVTAIAFCSTIAIGGLQAPSVSYADSTTSVSEMQPDTQKLSDFRKELKKHIDNHEENITITYNTNEKNGEEVLNKLYQEYNNLLAKDEYEYVKPNVAKVQWGLEGMPGQYMFKLNITYRESKEQTQFVKAQAKSIINSIVKPGMDQHEKVKAIHDYIVKHVSYDTSYKAYTAYEALANRSAVCQGYALLTYQLLTEAGIQAHYVTGKGNGGPHAWNLVKIENKWYHLDTTFDDPVPDKAGRVMYSYFNVTDEQLSKDHEWDRSKYPTATTSYFNELTNKIKAGSSKTVVYKQMLKETNLMYLSAEYGVENYNQLKQKLQQHFTAKPEKVELRYKKSMNETMQDIKMVLNETSWPQGAKKVSYHVAPYNAMEGYSLATITFTY